MRETLVKNEEFKDSSLGKIPKDWEVKSLGDCAFITKLAGFEYTNYFDYSQQGEIIAIRVLNIRNGSLDLTEAQTIPRKVAKLLTRSALHKGDLVISYVGTLGEVALIEEDDRFHLAPNVAKISPNPEIVISRFLFAQLLSQAAQKRLIDLSTLTSQPALSMGRLRQLEIALPPLEEQQYIAEIIETIDQTIAHTSSLIAKLKQMKAGLLHDLLTRGLDENGELRDATQHPEQFKPSPLGQIPKDWEVCPIEDKLWAIIDYRGKTPTKTDSGIPLITAKNVREGFIDPEPREYIAQEDYDRWMVRGIPKLGDVLFTTEAPLGMVAAFPKYKVALAQRLLTLCPDPEHLDSDYLIWLLLLHESRRRIEEKSSGSTVLGIKQSVFRKLLFKFPLLAEQKRISSILQIHDTRIRTEEAYRDKLKLQKQGLMHDLLTGKVRVKNA